MEVRGRGHLTLITFDGPNDRVDIGVEGGDPPGPMGDRKVSEHISPFIAARSYRPASARQRRQILGQFSSATGDPKAAELAPRHVVGWWDSISHLTAASRHSHLSGVKVFCAYLRAVKALRDDPTEVIARPKVHRKDPVTFSASEIIRILHAMPTTRDRAMVAFMLGCGLRSGEIARLQVGDVDEAFESVSVEGKGGTFRTVPIPKATRECLLDYLTEHPAEHGCGPLIRAFNTEAPLSPGHIQKRLVDLFYAAGVKRRPFDGRSSHALRRTCASVLLESGASIRDVQVILGHSSLSSTQHYLRRPEVARLASVIEQGPLA